jgi:hypothetical protein
MCGDVMRRDSVASARVLRATFARSCLHLRWPLVAGLSGWVLFGCAAEYGEQSSSRPKNQTLPLPRTALLTPPSDPGCALKSSDLSGGKDQPNRMRARVANLAGTERSDAAIVSGGPPSESGIASQPKQPLVQTDPNASLATRIKLEYERDCFQRAEARMRERLLQLQAEVRRTVAASRRREQD